RACSFHICLYSLLLFYHCICYEPLLPHLFRQSPPFTLFPYTTLFRSLSHLAGLRLQHADSLAVLLDGDGVPLASPRRTGAVRLRDRKSTRLNSSHVKISYAVFCLKKKIFIHTS